MTATQTVDLVSAMVGGAAESVAAATGAHVQVGQVVGLAPAEALAAGGSMINRAQLSANGQTGSLLVVVPASGLVTAEVAMDATALTNALIAGVTSGIVTAGGPLLQILPPQLVASASALDVSAADAVAFDLVVGTKVTTVILIVEATLGSLLAGPSPVDAPAPGAPRVASAQLPDLDRATIVPDSRPIEVLSDVATRVSVQIAQGTTQVKDLVAMRSGSVFALDRAAGDPVDVLVNGAIIGRGDIIVVGNRLGVRITKICGVDE